MPRVSASAASAEITKPASSSSSVRRIEASSFAYTSAAGCSTKTFQSSNSMRANAVSTVVPFMSTDFIAGSFGARPPVAAFTCASSARFVLRNTRPMSGSDTRKPLRSTTYALPLSPILMRDTTSHTNLRLMSAVVTGPFSLPARIAIVMYGSVSLRNETGLYQACLYLAF